MKIERISENQIRCTLTSTDLTSRNLNLHELAYGSEKARSLFHEMIQTASAELDFDAEDAPLMVEAIPLPNESIILLITKIDDPEELDTRFSRFSPMSDYEHTESWTDTPSEILEGADSFLGFLKGTLSGMPAPGTEQSTPDSTQAIPMPGPATRVFRFKNLDQVIEAAQAAGDICVCKNRLYKNPRDGQYYLLLKSSGEDFSQFSQVCNTLTEFAGKTHQESVTEAYFEEHYEVIVAEDALRKLKNV